MNREQTTRGKSGILSIMGNRRMAEGPHLIKVLPQNGLEFADSEQAWVLVPAGTENPCIEAGKLVSAQDGTDLVLIDQTEVEALAERVLQASITRKERAARFLISTLHSVISKRKYNNHQLTEPRIIYHPSIHNGRGTR